MPMITAGSGSRNTKVPWYIAVYVGSEELGWVQDPNAGRIECRVWDMLRYDRCYPASNGERFEEMGFILLKQPYQQDVKGGFTVGRWESMGFKTLFFGPASLSGSPSFNLEEACRNYAHEVTLRKREKERGNHG